FQQIRHWLVWPDQDFPRTPTQKPLLSQIEQAAEAQLGVGKMSTGVFPANRPLNELLNRIGGGHALGGSSDHLQLSSIERVELMSALEDRYQIDVSESEFTAVQTVGELERLIERPSAQSRVYHYPRWAQSWPTRIVRAAVFNLLARPAMLLRGWPGVTGRQNLSGLSSPALVISNHVAFFDPAYIIEALQSRFRRKLAIAMDGELLESMRNPQAGTPFFRGMANRAAYWLVISVYNVFPLPLHAGFRKSFAFAGELVDRGWSVLIFPEGTRTRDGKLSPFRAGIGLLATRLNVPIIPMRLNGVFELKAAGKRWAHPGQIGVAIGSPARFQENDDPEQIARELEQRVAELAN
ncbi:MAG: 1-acyl-sn-glycerol-3-phosphate acyltransferase, partial [Terracidiphilus sp.]